MQIISVRVDQQPYKLAAGFDLTAHITATNQNTNYAICSIGWQTLDNYTSLNLSQNFVIPDDETGGNQTAYIEASNTGLKPITIVFYAVISIPDGVDSSTIAFKTVVIGEYPIPIKGE